MTEHAWFKLFLRGIGVMLLGFAVPGLISQSGTIIQMTAGFSGMPGEYIWMYGGGFLGMLAQAGIGLYLLFGGGWIVTRCLREIRERCVACGYDLSATTVGVCTECGTPIIRQPASTLAAGPVAPTQPEPPQ